MNFCRTVEWDECDCSCHRSEGRVRHVMACCYFCGYCGKNIKPGFHKEHVARCGERGADTGHNRGPLPALPPADFLDRIFSGPEGRAEAQSSDTATRDHSNETVSSRAESEPAVSVAPPLTPND